WERLENDPLNSLHQSFGWCSIWAQTQDSALLTLRGRQRGKTIFLLPLEIVMEGGVRKARFPGGRFKNINTGLFDPSFAGQAGQEIAAAIAREARKLLHGRADILALHNIPLRWRDRT
ncbi:polysaccharide biosynthesis GNAT family N-acetyltransferase UppA, partial [Agrobacterium sp. ST15.16.024]|nr:polysaccharide biosynthesis GNAT family N-acetyltransferase UppA [Agrobacterium sp. ST15.16.024]